LEEVARLVGQIRTTWPKVRILLRADSGFTREALMVWCEANDVDSNLAISTACPSINPANPLQADGLRNPG
jgi:hypothetical protein